jgi:hypothetical protein
MKIKHQDPGTQMNTDTYTIVGSGSTLKNVNMEWNARLFSIFIMHYRLLGSYSVVDSDPDSHGSAISWVWIQEQEKRAKLTFHDLYRIPT